MIRRTFKLDLSHYDTEQTSDLELIVTYDPLTGTLNVGHREHGYDEWSRPIELIENMDDEPGRTGGPGMRGSSDDPSSLAYQMRALLDLYDRVPQVETPELATSPYGPGEMVPQDQLDTPEPHTHLSTSDE